MSLIRDLFVRNWGLKLFAVLLALALWLILIPEEKTYSEKTLTIPLETRNIPPDMELVEKPAVSVDVTVRARMRIIDQITPANVVAKLDLEKATIYQEEYPLNQSMISLPPGAEVLRITPSKVDLRLENTAQIGLDIVPTLIGKPAEGLKLLKIEVVPPQVEVKGPESKILKTDKVTTTPINLAALTDSTEIDADLILPRPEMRLVTPQTKVRVKIQMEKTEEPEPAPAKKK
ncbi:MAG: CdaR family protein [Acidobacteriota bacterium]|nr:CdaR family protein [Acidobacteriota bacterium]